MRAMSETLGAADGKRIAARAESWRPWRAYAALHLWVAGRMPATTTHDERPSEARAA